MTDPEYQALNVRSDTHFIYLKAMSTISAVLLNAHLLRIDCSKPQFLKAGFYFSSNLDVPEPLHPTSLQTIIPHMPVVDLVSHYTMNESSKILNILNISILTD
jgi:hypothetical protein